MVSSLSFWRSPLYFACNFLISGASFCMAIIDFACFAVSGKRISMIVIVSRMIETPRFGITE